MSIETASLPIGGTTILAGLAYAAFTWSVSSTETASREIDRDRWMSRCEADLAEEITPAPVPLIDVPEIPNICKMMFGNDPSAREICKFIPDAGEIVRQTERVRQAEESARVAKALDGVSDRCSCAVAVYLEDRLPLAIYAGSARVIRPSEVRDRDSILSRHLRAPQCRMEG